MQKKKQSSKAGQGESASMDTRVLHLLQKNPATKSIRERFQMQTRNKYSHNRLITYGRILSQLQCITHFKIPWIQCQN